MKTKPQISSAFNPLLCPPYQAATVGKWRLFSAATIPVPVAGYFTVHAPMPAEYWVLEKNAVVWMSLTPMEMESQGHHARLATGHVVVMGLGMGALVYNLLLNPLVTRITVCELEPDVVSLLKMAAPWFAAAVQSGQVEIHIGDAFNFIPTGNKPDTLIVDIWPKMGPRGETDTIKIQTNVNAGQVGWWGQEISYGSWVAKTFPSKQPPVCHKGQAAAYEQHLGFKLLGAQHKNYPTIARQANLTLAKIFNAQATGQIHFPSPAGNVGK